MWGNDVEFVVVLLVNDLMIVVDVATTNVAFKAFERVVECCVVWEEIEFLGGVCVLVFLCKVDKYLLFVIFINEMLCVDEVASARVEFVARRVETMRGYESIDSDDDEDEIIEEMKRDV